MAENGHALMESEERALAPVVETAATAAAAREKAVVEARYIVAMKRPRNMDDVRVRLLKECERPGFAEVAKYEKPVGGEKIVGLSVRFAETAIRLMTNVQVDVRVSFDDPTRRIVRVEVVDLETNTPYGQDIPIEKTVERKRPPSDREVLGQRTNTQGQTVYIVAATEDEFMNKQNAGISKVLRNHGLRLVPGDILEECSQKIDVTYRNKAAQDPEGEKKKIFDSFATLGVLPGQIAHYLQHPLEQIVPAELTMLRRLYQSIRDGETTWVAVMEEKFGEAGGGEGERPKPRRASEAKPAPAETKGPSADTKGPNAETKRPEAQTAPRTEPLPNGGTVTHLEGGGSVTHPPKTDAPAGKPNGGAIPKQTVSFKKAIELMPLMAKLDEKLGERGASKAMLIELYDVDSASKLTPEQADEWLGKLQENLSA